MLRKVTKVYMYVQCFSFLFILFQVWEDLLKFDMHHSLIQLSLKYLVKGLSLIGKN